ncbi:MAG: hypothetical protein AAF677_12975 [Pseudomonadota bacterium]
MLRSDGIRRLLPVLSGLVLAALAGPAAAQGEGRTVAMIQNCLDVLERDYGARDIAVGEIATREGGRTVIHIYAFLPGGAEEEMRCGIPPGGTGVDRVAVRRVVAGNAGWLPADQVLRPDRAAPQGPAPADPAPDTVTGPETPLPGPPGPDAD